VEDEALIDREDAGVRDSQIELHNSMVNLCESNRCLVTITRRIQEYTQVMVPCGNFATVYNRRHRQEEREKLSPRAALRGGISRRLAIVTLTHDGRMHGTELSASAYDFASSTISMVMGSYEFFYLLICAIHDEVYQGSCRTARSHGLTAATLSTHSNSRSVSRLTRRTPTMMLSWRLRMLLARKR
jgi:hypothetical protein